MAVSDFGCVNRICAEESEGGGHGGVGLCGLGHGEMHFVLSLSCESIVIALFVFLQKQGTASNAGVFLEVAMICTMNLAMWAAPHFSVARRLTGMSSTSTNTTSQIVYNGTHAVYDL